MISQLRGRNNATKSGNLTSNIRSEQLSGWRTVHRENPTARSQPACTDFTENVVYLA
jgi:hypothetical protein